jgi:hypothetical protein
MARRKKRKAASLKIGSADPGGIIGRMRLQRELRDRYLHPELYAILDKPQAAQAGEKAEEEKPPKPPSVGKHIYVSKELVRLVKGILTKKPHKKYSRKELAAEVRKPKWNYQNLPTDQNRQKTEFSNAVRKLRREGLCISRNPYQYRGTHTSGCDCFSGK